MYFKVLAVLWSGCVEFTGTVETADTRLRFCDESVGWVGGLCGGGDGLPGDAVDGDGADGAFEAVVGVGLLQDGEAVEEPGWDGVLDCSG